MSDVSIRPNVASILGTMAETLRKEIPKAGIIPEDELVNIPTLEEMEGLTTQLLVNGYVVEITAYVSKEPFKRT